MTVSILNDIKPIYFMFLDVVANIEKNSMHEYGSKFIPVIVYLLCSERCSFFSYCNKLADWLTHSFMWQNIRLVVTVQNQ